MKFIRYAKGKVEYRGILDGEYIKRINGTIFHDYSLTTTMEKVSDVTILPPVLPSKIIGFRKNYNGSREKIEPQIFLKPPTTTSSHNSNIIIPKDVENVKVEGELAVIISKKAKNISECHVLNHILGFTIANDVTSPQAKEDLTVTIGKSYDTFTPLGQYILTDTNYLDLEIKTYKNGELVQSGTTNNMIYDIFYQISFISHIMTLNAGDVILTGTPSDAVSVTHGDKIDIEISKLGTLSNTIIKEGL